MKLPKLKSLTFVTVMLMVMLLCHIVPADPCGMVPPIYIGPGSAIARTGLQQTYVFFDRDVESFVIRPGFTGKVDNFGMLIPFPTPPAIRKVPDNVFLQIKNAIDPPEVVVDLRPVPVFARGGGGGGFGGAVAESAKLVEKPEDRLEVLNEEAVGMYEVAVLSAGSAKALKKWMDENKFQYPTGMDKVTNEYVKLGWCFVAVKTKVSQKSSAEPKPGQRQVNPGMPAGASFDGAVQGLGFRFQTKDLVVPMRLSAFNEGEMRNVVYLLTRGAKKIRSIPEEYVVRQLGGRELIKNLNGPLPLRIIGGTAKDIPESRRKAIDLQRDPTGSNGVAKSLFASDLYASKMFARDRDTLSLAHEQHEKELLKVGEHLGLRGPDYDSLLESKSNDQSKHLFDEISGELAKMTLTVVDGDFPREVVANENLSFDGFRMARARNSAKFYDAKLHGPAPEKTGNRISAADPWRQLEKTVDPISRPAIAAIGVLGFAFLLLPLSSLRRTKIKDNG